jgi:hypothetical protein
MGVFYEMQEIINRAPVDLTVTFDGQCKTIKPGRTMIPKITIPYAKNQNPIMGTQDPNNPTIYGCRFLIGVPGEDLPEDLEPLTPEEWADHLGQPQRIDSKAAFEENYGGDPKAKLVVRGKGQKLPARNSYEAGGAGKRGDVSSFDHDK